MCYSLKQNMIHPVPCFRTTVPIPILPDALAYYKSEEGQQEFTKWKEQHLKGGPSENV